MAAPFKTPDELMGEMQDLNSRKLAQAKAHLLEQLTALAADPEIIEASRVLEADPRFIATRVIARALGELVVHEAPNVRAAAIDQLGHGANVGVIGMVFNGRTGA